MDAMWNGGNYASSRDLTGFRLARKLGLCTYRNAAEWNQRFNSHDGADANDTDIVEYMDYNAEKFCRTFDANSYLVLTRSMDLFDVTKNYSSLQQWFSRISARTLVVHGIGHLLHAPAARRTARCVVRRQCGLSVHIASIAIWS